MAIILNIETSGKICSVALTRDGVLEFSIDDREGMKHAECLAPFVEKALAEVKRKEWTLDAVAVSIGPGSYTGLRNKAAQQEEGYRYKASLLALCRHRARL